MEIPVLIVRAERRNRSQQRRQQKASASSYIISLHCKKRFAVFPSPAGMSLEKLSLADNYLTIPHQGDGKTAIFFYSVESYDRSLLEELI